MRFSPRLFPRILCFLPPSCPPMTGRPLSSQALPGTGGLVSWRDRRDGPGTGVRAGWADTRGSISPSGRGARRADGQQSWCSWRRRSARWRWRTSSSSSRRRTWKGSTRDTENCYLVRSLSDSEKMSSTLNACRLGLGFTRTSGSGSSGTRTTTFRPRGVWLSSVTAMVAISTGEVFAGAGTGAGAGAGVAGSSFSFRPTFSLEGQLSSTFFFPFSSNSNSLTSSWVKKMSNIRLRGGAETDLGNKLTVSVSAQDEVCGSLQWNKVLNQNLEEIHFSVWSNVSWTGGGWNIKHATGRLWWGSGEFRCSKIC